MRTNRRKIHGLAILALAGALTVFGPGRAAGQETVSLRVLEAGRPVPGIEVVVLFLGEAWRVGETRGDGTIVAPIDLVGLEPGDRVGIHRMACGGPPVLVLAPPDEDARAECARRGGRAEACRCREVGSFLWGDDATIDLTGETAAARPERRRERPGAAPRDGATWTAAVGGGLASFPDLDLACQPGAAAPPVASCDVEGEAPILRATLEVRPRADMPWLSLAADFGWATGLEVGQAFETSPNPREPRGNLVELDVLTLGGLAVGRWALSPSVDAVLALGYLWAYNRADVTTAFGPPDRTVTEDREDSGGRVGGRVGIDWWRSDRWGIRLEAGGMVGDEDDTDTSWHVAGLLLLPLGGAR